MAVVTKTLKTGGDFTSMVTWESSSQTNLVTDTDTHVLECYDDWPTGLLEQVQLSGWTTSADYYITIKTAAGEGHGGVIKGGFYLRWNATNTYCFDCVVDYTRFEDFEIWNEDTTTSSNAPKGIQINADYITMDRCIIGTDCLATCGFNGAVRHYDVGGSLLRNCLIITKNGYNSNSALYTSSVSSTYKTLENCTLINKSAESPTYAVYMSGLGADKWEFNNCAFYAPTGTEVTYSNGNPTSLLGDYNALSDAYNDAYVGANSIHTLATTDFVDYANNDFSIDTDSALYDAGADLSVDFTVDIAGNPRS